MKSDFDNTVTAFVESFRQKTDEILTVTLQRWSRDAESIISAEKNDCRSAYRVAYRHWLDGVNSATQETVRLTGAINGAAVWPKEWKHPIPSAEFDDTEAEPKIAWDIWNRQEKVFHASTDVLPEDGGTPASHWLVELASASAASELVELGSNRVLDQYTLSTILEEIGKDVGERLRLDTVIGDDGEDIYKLAGQTRKAEYVVLNRLGPPLRQRRAALHRRLVELEQTGEILDCVKSDVRLKAWRQKLAALQFGSGRVLSDQAKRIAQASSRAAISFVKSQARSSYDDLGPFQETLDALARVHAKRIDTEWGELEASAERLPREHWAAAREGVERVFADVLAASSKDELVERIEVDQENYLNGLRGKWIQEKSADWAEVAEKRREKISQDFEAALLTYRRDLLEFERPSVDADEGGFDRNGQRQRGDADGASESHLNDVGPPPPQGDELDDTQNRRSEEELEDAEEGSKEIEQPFRPRPTEPVEPDWAAMDAERDELAATIPALADAQIKEALGKFFTDAIDASSVFWTDIETHFSSSHLALGDTHPTKERRATDEDERERANQDLMSATITYVDKTKRSRDKALAGFSEALILYLVLDIWTEFAQRPTASAFKRVIEILRGRKRDAPLPETALPNRQMKRVISELVTLGGASRLIDTRGQTYYRQEILLEQIDESAERTNDPDRSEKERADE